ncbi:MAG: DNA replication/repair protein RecF [Negativicutes bacterium]|nr:DNA replication/repair protein RecF [Negativicutes bacterium]
MRVTRLTLRNFRNYHALTLPFNHNIVIFTGANAQGKTNILEAIYTGAMGRSHRTHADDDLIRWEQSAALVEIAFQRQDIDHSLMFKFIKDQNKEILWNGNPIKAREIVGTLNVVLFSPEDLLLVKGAPALRRRFLDVEISQANPAYYRQLSQYNRMLQQRNHLLKKIREKKAGPELLDAWDEQLAPTAAVIVKKRLEAVKKFNMLANLMHRKLTGNKENLSVQYVLQGSEGKIPDDLCLFFKDSFSSQRLADIARGSTGSGPHRDDIYLSVNGQNLRVFGSQGQQRTGVLALKLAELEFIKSETGEYPVLLLDDVMSELDASRREYLLSFIRDKIQTFITATDITAFPEIKYAKFYRVSQGNILE